MQSIKRRRMHLRWSCLSSSLQDASIICLSPGWAYPPHSAPSRPSISEPRYFISSSSSLLLLLLLLSLSFTVYCCCVACLLPFLFIYSLPKMSKTPTRVDDTFGTFGSLRFTDHSRLRKVALKSFPNIFITILSCTLSFVCHLPTRARAFKHSSIPGQQIRGLVQQYRYLGRYISVVALQQGLCAVKSGGGKPFEHRRKSITRDNGRALTQQIQVECYKVSTPAIEEGARSQHPSRPAERCSSLKLLFFPRLSGTLHRRLCQS